MPQFQPVDLSSWERLEIYEYFSGTVMYTTVHLDITGFLSRIKARGLRFYPAIIYCIASVANCIPDYRYGYDNEGQPGIWERVDPLYTVPRRETPSLFSMTSTEYCGDYGTFLSRFERDYARAEACGGLQCGPMNQRNYLGITAMPDLHFSSFAFGDTEKRPDLTPFFVVGKYERQGDRDILPIFGEFCHSVNDGYHITRFFKELEQTLATF